MAISLRAAGTPTAGNAATTAINPAVPAGTVSGDFSLLGVEHKQNTAGSAGTITTPSGWTLVGTVLSNGTLGAANDTGSNTVGVYFKTTAVASDTTGNITFGNANSAAACICSFQGNGAGWDTSIAVSGSDTSSGANGSITGGGWASAVTTGDLIIVVIGVSGDVGTISAVTIGGMAGATVGSTTTHINHDVTTGNDSALVIASAPITAGSSSSAPTVTWTNASSTTAAAQFLRLREGTLQDIGTDALGLSDSGAVRDYDAVASTTMGLTDEVTTQLTGGGGTNFTETPSDTEGLTDAVSLAVGLDRTDALGLTDTASPVVAFSRTIDDTQGLSDSGAALDRAGTATDGLGLTDDITTQLTAGGSNYTETPSDTEGLTDALALAVGLDRTDALGLTDTVTTQVAKTVTQSDTEGLTDTVTVAMAYVITIDDSTGVTDGADGYTDIYGDAYGDQSLIIELTSGGTAHTVTINDNLGLTDALALSRGLVITDTQGLTDATTTALGGAFNLPVDSTGLTDSGVALDRTGTTTDTLGLSDSVTTQLTGATAHVVTINDSMTVDDDLVVQYTITTHWWVGPYVEDGYQAIDNDLHVRMNLRRGITVLNEGGSYRQVRNPTQEELAAADAAYEGGYEYPLTASEVASLTSAGYGSYITTRTV